MFRPGPAKSYDCINEVTFLKKTPEHLCQNCGEEICVTQYNCVGQGTLSSCPPDLSLVLLGKVSDDSDDSVKLSDDSVKLSDDYDSDDSVKLFRKLSGSVKLFRK